MADPIDSGAPPVSTEATPPVAAPAAAVPVPVAPIVALEAAPAAAAVIETSAAEPIAPVDAASTEVAKEPERRQNLLAKFEADKAAKDAADKAATPDGEVKPAEPAVPAETVLTLKFDIPQGFNGEVPEMQAFTGIVGEIGKSSPQEVGQKLLNLHAEAMQKYSQQVSQQVSDNQWKVWNDLLEAKEKEVLADEEIGGPGYETAMRNAIETTQQFLRPDERRQWDEFAEVTGAGSWPIFLKLLSRVRQYMKEPPLPAPNGRPPANIGVDPRKAGGGVLHDHPRSSLPNGRA